MRVLQVGCVSYILHLEPHTCSVLSATKRRPGPSSPCLTSPYQVQRHIVAMWTGLRYHPPIRGFRAGGPRVWPSNETRGTRHTEHPLLSMLSILPKMDIPSEDVRDPLARQLSPVAGVTLGFRALSGLLMWSCQHFDVSPSSALCMRGFELSGLHFAPGLFHMVLYTQTHGLNSNCIECSS